MSCIRWTGTVGFAPAVSRHVVLLSLGELGRAEQGPPARPRGPGTRSHALKASVGPVRRFRQPDVAWRAVGAKSALSIYADGDVARALHDAVELDRAATEALAARLMPGADMVAVRDGSLDRNIYPADGLLYAAVFPGLTVICAGQLAEIRPSAVRSGWLAQGLGQRVILHSMHSVSDFLGFATWREDGTPQRALCLSPDQGVVEDRGDRLPFEQAYWAGQHPVEQDEHEQPYPLPFHPLQLGEEVLSALCGFVLEGFPLKGMPDLSRVPLAGFRLGVKATLERSHGRPIMQPSNDEVQAEVHRLGDGLDHLILELGSDNYLQAAAGGQYDIPVGVFWVERREGGPDAHFRCEVDSVEEVAEIFRGYLTKQEAWGSRHWRQVRL